MLVAMVLLASSQTIYDTFAQFFSAGNKETVDEGILMYHSHAINHITRWHIVFQLEC